MCYSNDPLEEIYADLDTLSYPAMPVTHTLAIGALNEPFLRFGDSVDGREEKGGQRGDSAQLSLILPRLFFEF